MNEILQLHFEEEILTMLKITINRPIMKLTFNYFGLVNITFFIFQWAQKLKYTVVSLNHEIIGD